MPSPPTFTPKYLYDYLRDFTAGQHAGLDPLLLPRNQASALFNCTSRGGFLTHRPSNAQASLDFGGNDDLRIAFQTGLFQGAQFYKDDYGNVSLVASVSGRLFQLLFDVGNLFIVREITIQNDPNPPGVAQVWMWQSERWLIINDGQSVPIFFDGNTCRRAVQVEETLGTLANPQVTGTNTIPDIGKVFTTDLTANFTGSSNQLVRIRDGAGVDYGFFQTINAQTTYNGYQAVLTNNSDNPITVPDQSIIYIPPTPGSTNVIGVTAQNKTLPSGTKVTVALQAPTPKNISDGGNPRVDFFDSSGNIRFGGLITFNWELGTGAFTNITNESSSQVGISSGWTIKTRFGVNVAPTPAFPASTTFGAFTIPAHTSQVIQLNTPYTGPNNQDVTINGQHFIISKAVNPVVTNQVTLLNLTGTGGTVIQLTTGTPPGPAIIVSVPELPPGRMGAYILGRNWVSGVDGQSFIAGDIVNGVSGTPAFNRRDAVLHVTENTLLAGGGAFRVPSSGEDIRAIIATPVLDVSLGQGPILVLTRITAFSCNASPDRSTWQNTTSPILTVALIGNGAEGQNSTVTENSDILFRSLDGIRSYLLSRINFDKWGQTPQSFEVQPTILADDEGLLPFGSAVIFNNRMLMTAHPQHSDFGIYHDQLIALNFDLISSMRGKAPAAYDGIWSGLNVLQILNGTFSGVQRCFAFCIAPDFSGIVLFEVLQDGAATDDDGTPITWELQSSGALNFHQEDPDMEDTVRLIDGELRVDGLTAPVDVAAYYKPDATYPTWVPWVAFNIGFDGTSDPGFRPELGFGEPPADVFDETNNRPLRDFSTMQFRMVVTGHAKIKLIRFKAAQQPALDFAIPPQ